MVMQMATGNAEYDVSSSGSEPNLLWLNLANIWNVVQIRFTKPLDKVCLSEMKKRLPSINALRSFEAAARHQSFALAAAELSVSPAAIGFQVKRLEEDFGSPLFIRKHRGILLTPEGNALMRQLGKGFEIIEGAWNNAQVPDARTPLTVTAPIAVVQKWLINEPAFQTNADEPFRIAWDVVQAFRDLNGSGIDAAIRYTASPDPDVFSEPLLRQCYTPLMRPDVAQKIKAPSDLLKHGLIDLGFDLASEPDLNVWKPWFKAQGLQAPNRYEMVCGYTMAAIEMAIKTGNIAIGGYFVVKDDIASGRLVAPFDVAILPQSQLWFMCRKGREEEPEISWFRQAVRDSALRLKATAAHFMMYDLSGERLSEEQF